MNETVGVFLIIINLGTLFLALYVEVEEARAHTNQTKEKGDDKSSISDKHEKEGTEDVKEESVPNPLMIFKQKTGGSSICKPRDVEMVDVVTVSKGINALENIFIKKKIKNVNESTTAAILARASAPPDLAIEIAEHELSPKINPQVANSVENPDTDEQGEKSVLDDNESANSTSAVDALPLPLSYSSTMNLRREDTNGEEGIRDAQNKDELDIGVSIRMSTLSIDSDDEEGYESS